MKKAILIFCIILNMTYTTAYSETILDLVSSTFFPLFNQDQRLYLFCTGQNYAWTMDNKAWNGNDTNSLYVIWLEA